MTLDTPNLPARIVHEGEVLSRGEQRTKPRRLLNVKDYGARGDGVADDTAAIQSAIFAAAATFD